MSDEVNKLLEEREKTHGDFAKQAITAMALKYVIEQTPNWKEMPSFMRESLDLMATKISRMCHGNMREPEHMRDCAGYAMLIVRELEK